MFLSWVLDRYREAGVLRYARLAAGGITCFHTTARAPPPTSGWSEQHLPGHPRACLQGSLTVWGQASPGKMGAGSWTYLGSAQ